MDFLARFNPRNQERLLSLSVTLRLSPGQLLIRRGERGGDIFRVVEGELEVVDNRLSPPMILEVIGKGGVVGEIAFLDEQARSADVRAPEGAVCQRWERRVLLQQMEQDPLFAGEFYRVLALLAVDRTRAVTSSAVMGALGRPATREALNPSGAKLGEALSARLVEVEHHLRRDADAARREIIALLHTFQEQLHQLITQLGPDEGAAAGQAAARALHPYIMRSQLGELALDRLDGHTGDVHCLAHIQRNQPRGDGVLGEILDNWLLGLPTSRSLRERSATIAAQVLAALPPAPPFRITLINTGIGAIFQPILTELGRMGGELTAIDGRRDNLVLLETNLSPRPKTIRLRLVQEDPVQLCLGLSRQQLQPQHMVILHGLFEYLPERIAATLIEQARGWLQPGGQIIISTLQDAPDVSIYRFLLEWPTIRRAPSALSVLLEGAGAAQTHSYAAGPVGVVTVGVWR